MIGIRIFPITDYRRRRQPGKIEGQSTEQGRGIGGRIGLDPGGIESVLHEGIDRMDSFGHGGTNDRLKGPVFSPLASLGDPAFQHVDLGRGKGTAQLGWRHLLLGIFAEEAEDQFARIGMAFGNDAITVPIAFGVGFIIETQIAFAAFLGIGAVALEAGVREDRQDVPRKDDGRWRSRPSGDGGKREYPRENSEKGRDGTEWPHTIWVKVTPFGGPTPEREQAGGQGGGGEGMPNFALAIPGRGP